MPGRALAMVKALTSTQRRDASSRLGEWSSRPARQPGWNPWDVVGEGGVEPPRPYGHTDLNRARLPFRHSPVDSDRGYHSVACPHRAPWRCQFTDTITQSREGSRRGTSAAF